MDKTPIYQLSEYGRSITWDSWKFLGGCGLPNSTRVFRTLKPMSFWGESMTLGQIEDACMFTGRSLARFAVQNLNMPELAKPYAPQCHEMEKS